MSERCPSSRVLFRARLEGYRLDFTHLSRRWGGGAADVVAHAGESVWGVVYALAPTDLTRLDRFESGYDRLHLGVSDEQLSIHTVLTYSVRNKGTHTPTDEYLEKMLRWGAHWSFPDAYLERLRRLARMNCW